jgi:hypothetical protein
MTSLFAHCDRDAVLATRTEARRLAELAAEARPLGQIQRLKYPGEAWLATGLPAAWTR